MNTITEKAETQRLQGKSPGRKKIKEFRNGFPARCCRIYWIIFISGLQGAVPREMNETWRDRCQVLGHQAAANHLKVVEEWIPPTNVAVAPPRCWCIFLRFWHSTESPGGLDPMRHLGLCGPSRVVHGAASQPSPGWSPAPRDSCESITGKEVNCQLLCWVPKQSSRELSLPCLASGFLHLERWLCLFLRSKCSEA